MEEINNLVLEKGIANMILEYKTDLEEIELYDNFFVRKLDNNKYKIYKDNQEFILETYEDCSKDFNKFFNKFLLTYSNLKNKTNFMFEFLVSCIIYSFKQDKNNIYKYIDEYDIINFIDRTIKDKLSDIMYENNINPNNMFSDYDFPETVSGYEELDSEEELDLNYDMENNINIIDIVEDFEDEEINRFRNYLNNKNLLLDIEISCIKDYFYIFKEDLEFILLNNKIWIRSRF